jgi:hypothetical protein
MKERVDAEGGRAGRRGGGALGAVACLVIVVALSAGCSGSTSGDVAQPLPSSSFPSESTTASPTDATSPNEQAIEQYRAFWSVLPAVSAAPAAKRRTMLQPYAADPELASLVQAMESADQRPSPPEWCSSGL